MRKSIVIVASLVLLLVAVGRSSAQGIKISELPEVTSPASTDVLPIVSGGATKKVQVANLFGIVSSAHGGNGADFSGCSGALLFASGTATCTGTSGTGNFARVTSPSFVTPSLGTASASTINGNTFTAGTYTLTGGAGKTFTFNNTLTLSGTDGSTLNVGGGGTLGSNAFTSTAFVPQTTTVCGHALSANVTCTASDVSLGNVTNDAQTKAAIVPNTAPSAGQILAGNAGGTAYAPVTVSGSGATISLSSGGVVTISAVANASLSNSNITIAGNSTALGGSITLDTIDNGLSSNGLIARTAANTRAARTITGTTNYLTVSNGDGVAGNPTLNIGANVVATDRANTYTTGAQDFSSATSLKPPTSAGATPTTEGLIAFDSTSHTLEYGENGTNRTVANLDGSQTFTNKTISGSSNTLSNIANASLTNSSVTVGTTSISLGASATTIAGLTQITDPLVIGGTAVGSNAEIRSTSAAGTTDFIKFTVGNGGATEAGRFTHSGGLSVGATGDVAAGTINANVGFTVAGAATSGQALIGDGTKFVSTAFAKNTFVASCSGTATASTTLYLFPVGQISAFTCTITSATAGIPMPSAGTLRNLRFLAGTGGKAGDAVTILKGASATGMPTCTFGTGTTCSDTSTQGSVVAGDAITVKITTGTSETLANVHVSFELWN